MKSKLTIVITLITLAIAVGGCSTQTQSTPASKSADSHQSMMNQRHHQEQASNKDADVDNQPMKNHHMADQQMAKSMADNHHHSQMNNPELRHNKNYVKNGNLSKPQQFSYDQIGTKQTLKAIKKPQRQIQTSTNSYVIQKVRVLKNHPESVQAQRIAMQVLNLPTLPKTYYTFVLNYRFTNLTNQPVILNGVSAIKTNQGQTLRVNMQLTDSAVGKKVLAHQTQDFVITGYLHDYEKHPATNLTVQFGKLYDLKHQPINTAKIPAFNVNI